MNINEAFLAKLKELQPKISGLISDNLDDLLSAEDKIKMFEELTQFTSNLYMLSLPEQDEEIEYNLHLKILSLFDTPEERNKLSEEENLL